MLQPLVIDAPVPPQGTEHGWGVVRRAHRADAVDVPAVPAIDISVMLVSSVVKRLLFR